MNIKRLVSVFIIFLFCLYSQGQSGKPGDKGGVLRAGMAKTDITPDQPVMLYGYDQRKTPSEGILDPLSARVVVFENNGKKVVLVSSDLGSFGAEVFPVIQKAILDKFKLKESELFLSAIHSHSSPVLSLNNGKGNPNNIRYTEILIQKLLAGIGEAFNNLNPVQTGVGVGYSAVGVNRREMRPDGSVALGRDPYGTTDKEVLVMKIARTDGTSVGAIFDYATHGTSLTGRSMKISGDVPGLAAQFVEKILGKDVVSPVFAGASGNINPWLRVSSDYPTESGWIPEPVLLGTLLGEEVVHVFREIKVLSPGGDISTSFATIDCPRWEQEENKDKTSEANPGATLPVNITVARVGDDVAFIGFNVEMLTEIGMAIKSASPFTHTFVITHCNGSSGYLAPAGLYKEGGYEITSTHFKIGSADMVVKKALRMLYDLK